jgi:hypothetical protein
MNPNEKELLEKTYELEKENNRMLRSIRNSGRWALIFRVFYWLIIIGLSVGAFYFIQPYLQSLMDTYSNVQDSIGNINSLWSK